jgi:hypothetical protein
MADPTNIRTTRTDIDGWVVQVEWDGGNTSSAFLYDASGSYAQSLTVSATLRRAFVPGGSSLKLMLKDQWGGSSAKVPFTADPATTPVPPPPPPPELTAEQHLEAALGVDLAAGDQVAVYPSPSTVLTVNADGSVA